MCVRLRDLADVGNVRRLGGSLHARVRYVPSVTSYVPLEPTVLAEEAVHLRAACARQDSRARGALTRASVRSLMTAPTRRLAHRFERCELDVQPPRSARLATRLCAPGPWRAAEPALVRELPVTGAGGTRYRPPHITPSVLAAHVAACEAAWSATSWELIGS
eukprot:CAMPEP_0205893066 /NCGR_PEP_ID=MMETSP1083-20121108/23034_1 /ASSEMBLY_ACC=CAM_ASM_000430 /TAXON_ID=97485 /ORGANISM="Prymnesium parvum, Strain Texoma1" /LENGTH=161 /DNA_ID=CAMNT_0053257671 /DNA_START=248 /DNA_END=730 /DNA_ORIENTATION=-